MEKIYIGLSTKNHFNIPSELIKLGEGSQYSHVYIRRKSSYVGEYIYQATAAGGVNFMGIDIFLSKNKIIEEYEFEITRDQMNELLRFFIKNAGKKYSYKQVIILSAIIISQKLGFNCKYCNNIIIDGNDKYICSELGAIILKNIEGIAFNSLDIVTPKKLQPYLIKYGKRNG